MRSIYLRYKYWINYDDEDFKIQLDINFLIHLSEIPSFCFIQ
jgi:hypothetical protein